MYLHMPIYLLIAKWKRGICVSEYGMVKSMISTILEQKEADTARGVKVVTKQRSQMKNKNPETTPFLYICHTINNTSNNTR